MGQINRLLIIFILFYATSSFCQEDCIDNISGNIIPDCSCTDIYQNIVSCTDPNIIIVPFPGSGGGGDDDDDDSGGGSGGGGDDDDDDNGDHSRTIGRVAINKHRQNKLLGFHTSISPSLISVSDLSDPFEFDIFFQTIWSGESQWLKDGDNFSIEINRDGIPLLMDVDFYVEQNFLYQNMISYNIFLEPPLKQSIFTISLKFNGKYLQTYHLFVYKNKHNYNNGKIPINRNVIYRNILDR